MKKLKIILLFSLIVILGIRIYLVYNYSSIYSNGYISLKGVVTNIKYDNDITTITIKEKENILVKYYNHIELEIGDRINIYGEFKDPEVNKVFNLFNYKKYLLSKKIYKVLTAESITIIGRDNNILYKTKNLINKRLNSINNSYLYTLILADNRIDDKIYESYQINGIVHLFSISGMHINFFSLILLKIFNKIFNNKRIGYIITSLFLISYMLMIGTSSIMRSVLMFTFISLFKIFKIKVKTLYILILIFYILLFINPYYIYDIGFQYSFIISFILIKFNYLYKDKKYFTKLFIISLIATLASYPITINNNFYINPLSPIINLIFVPFISFIIFPMSIIIFIIPYFNNILIILINILENISLLITKYTLIINFGYMNIYMITIYYIILYSLLERVKIYKLIILLVFFLIHYNIHLFNLSNNITMINVSQGDSLLIEIKNHEVILIDTGGNIYYDISKNIIIPYLNSLGIRKIDYLILTHGDYDHMGSAEALIKNFKVSNIIMNSNNDNDLEKEIIYLTKDKNIKVHKYSKKKLRVNNNYLYFLNNSNIDENNDSLIIYTKLNNIGILLMGDATKEEEGVLLRDYNLDVDILKVGHHGSDTSSSKEFIDSVNPKYSLISVGKNNRYGHPKESILETLKNSKIYRTDQDGSIEIKLNRNGYKIRTCNP